MLQAPVNKGLTQKTNSIDSILRPFYPEVPKSSTFPLQFTGLHTPGAGWPQDQHYFWFKFPMWLSSSLWQISGSVTLRMCFGSELRTNSPSYWGKHDGRTNLSVAVGVWSGCVTLDNRQEAGRVWAGNVKNPPFPAAQYLLKISWSRQRVLLAGIQVFKYRRMWGNISHLTYKNISLTCSWMKKSLRVMHHSYLR